MTADAHIANQQAAVAHYFGGDQALFDAFLRVCQAQFPADLAQGRAACQAADWQALRRTAHNLKSVLLTLGYEKLSQSAQQCEAFCQQGHPALTEACWAELEAGVLAEFPAKGD